ncbi:MAG: methyltransferase domain-containing protein [Pseudomonadota bacterium]
MTTVVEWLFRPAAQALGYELIRSGADAGPGGGAKQFEYRAADGTFDYKAYRDAQVKGNREKLDRVWAQEENIKFLADFVQARRPDPTFGLCHGTRRGLEQTWFRDALDCEVIGTEISDTAAEFPHTIQWDFHEVKPEWEGAADFIYSNSLDHSFDPKLALNRWMSCLKPGGLCLIEHSSWDEPEYVDAMDPFGASLSLLPYLILEWGEGKFAAREIVDLPVVRKGLAYLKVIVIQNAE